MAVKGDQRRSFSAVTAVLDLPEGGEVRVGITEEGEIKLVIPPGRRYMLEGMWSYGPHGDPRPTSLILVPVE